MEKISLNFEQDSVGNQAWVASLYTPACGLTQGRGTSPEKAILDLAGKIRQAQNREAVKRMTEIEMSQWRETAVFVSPDKCIEHVGKIVWYTPSDSDMFQESSGVLPAIVTRAWRGNNMDIQVFSGNGTHTRFSVPYNPTPMPQTWRWPEISN